MDLANLINQLESIIESGRKVPVANKTLVDTEQILSVIDQMRALKLYRIFDSFL